MFLCVYQILREIFSFVLNDYSNYENRNKQRQQKRKLKKWSARNTFKFSVLIHLSGEKRKRKKGEKKVN